MCVRVRGWGGVEDSRPVGSTPTEETVTQEDLIGKCTEQDTRQSIGAAESLLHQAGSVGRGGNAG